MESAYLEWSSYTGIAATFVLTFNFLLGMLISTHYKKNKYWRKLPDAVQQADVVWIHNWTAYVALALVLLHPLLLLPDASLKFKWVDILLPLHAPTERMYVAMGSISLTGFLIIVVTSQKFIKKKLGFRAWKNIHLVSYLLTILFVVHGLFMDPLLKDRPVDFLDAEKVCSEGCGIVLLIATLFRIRYARAEVATKKGRRNQDF